MELYARQQKPCIAYIDATLYRAESPIFDYILYRQQVLLYSYHIVAICQAEAYEARIDDLHYRVGTRNLHEESRRIVQKRAFASACSQACEDSLHVSNMAWHCA